MQTNSTTEPNDAALLCGFAERRDIKAFEELVRRHEPMVQAVAARMAGQAAEDVAQIVFAELARRAGSLTGVISLGAWLHRVAAVQSRRYMRQLIRAEHKHAAYAAEMSTPTITEADDPLREALPVLDMALNDLKEEDRELIFLRYYEKASFKSLAERLGKNESALRQQVGRAMDRLSVALKQRGVAVPTAALMVALSGVLHPASSSAAVSTLTLATAARVLATSLPAGTTTATTLATLSASTKTGFLAAIAALLIIAVPLYLQEVSAGVLEAQNKIVTPASSKEPKPVSHSKRQANTPSTATPLLNEEDQHLEVMRRILSTTVGLHSLKTADTLGWTEPQRRSYQAFMERDIVAPSFMDDSESTKAGQLHAAKTPQEHCVRYVRENFPATQALAFEDWMAEQEVGFSEMSAAETLAKFTGAIDMSEEQKEALFQAFAQAALSRMREGFKRTCSFNVTLGRIHAPAPHEDIELLSATLSQEQLQRFRLGQNMVKTTLEIIKPQGLSLLRQAFTEP